MIVNRIHICLGLLLAISTATIFAQRGPAIPQQLAFTPHHTSGIY